MKKLPILLLITLLLMSAVPTIKLMRFEVINKSNMPATLKLHEVNYDQPFEYFLSIPAGVDLPGIKLFTVARGIYDVEVWACGQLQPTQFINLNLDRAFSRFVIVPCNITEAKGGDGVVKYNNWLFPYEDEFGTQLIYDLGGSFKWRY